MSADMFGWRDAERARHERDAALQRVSSNAGRWIDRAMAAISLVPAFEGTAEDLRFRLVRDGLEPPHHHNAWGAVTRKALDRGLLKRTGKLRAMTGAKSHARRTEVYIK
jgi:hypothetical protein